MNRSERRAGKWDKFCPRLDYDDFVAEANSDAVKLMIIMLRAFAGDDAPFDDRDLWNGIRDLVKAGLLNIYFRFDGDGVEIHPEFLHPSVKENRPATEGGVA